MLAAALQKKCVFGEAPVNKRRCIHALTPYIAASKKHWEVMKIIMSRIEKGTAEVKRSASGPLLCCVFLEIFTSDFITYQLKENGKLSTESDLLFTPGICNEAQCQKSCYECLYNMAQSLSMPLMMQKIFQSRLRKALYPFCSHYQAYSFLGTLNGHTQWEAPLRQSQRGTGMSCVMNEQKPAFAQAGASCGLSHTM